MSHFEEYRCDCCKERLNDRGVGQDYLLLRIAPQSGRVGMTEDMHGWRLQQEIQPRQYHFCDAKCLAAYFGPILVKPEYYKNKPGFLVTIDPQ